MPVLREVVTRFKFETDEQATRKVDQRVNKMKRGISGIGKALGLAVGIAGAKALFSFGQSATRAEFTLKNLAGIEFTPLRKSMNKIREDLDLIREGAGAIFRERDFDMAAAGFVRTFGAGRKELELFDQIFRSAAKQSAVTGQNVVELVQQLTQAVSGGDFSALLNLPGIDQAFVKRTEDINELFNLGEIGGQSAINQRTRALVDALKLVSDQQDKSLKEVPAQLLLADRAAKKAQDSTEKLAESLNRTLIPVMQKLNQVLDHFVTTVQNVDQRGITGTIIDAVGLKPMDDFFKDLRRKTNIKALRTGRTDQGSEEEVREAKRLGSLPGGEDSPLFKKIKEIARTKQPTEQNKNTQGTKNLKPLFDNKESSFFRSIKEIARTKQPTEQNKNIREAKNLKPLFDNKDDPLLEKIKKIERAKPAAVIDRKPRNETKDKKPVIFNSTINVNGTGDPVAVAKEVERIQSETFNSALQNIVQTEDR